MIFGGEMMIQPEMILMVTGFVSGVLLTGLLWWHRQSRELPARYEPTEIWRRRTAHERQVYRWCQYLTMHYPPNRLPGTMSEFFDFMSEQGMVQGRGHASHVSLALLDLGWQCIPQGRRYSHWYPPGYRHRRLT